MISVTDGSGNNVSGNASHIANLNPIRYRGYYYDTETGLYYLQSRYYDPEIGRFISADGLLRSSPLGYNVFAYCENNPIVRSDPSGMCYGFAYVTYPNCRTTDCLAKDEHRRMALGDIYPFKYSKPRFPIMDSNAQIGCKFGCKCEGVHEGISDGHHGVDIINVGRGTPVYSSSSGEVIAAVSIHTAENDSEASGGFGNHVRIRMNNGYLVTYAHLMSVSVQVGDRVDIRQQIGTVGSTGWSEIPHLHIELRNENSVRIDPAEYFKFF